MKKQHFYMKLIPPRATFPADITPAERELMALHAQYARKHFDGKSVLAYGPVMTPTGAFGFCVLEMDDADEARRFAEEDPSVKAGLNTFEIYPMRLGGAQGSSLG